MFDKIIAFFRGNLSYSAIIGDFNKTIGRLDDFYQEQVKHAELAANDIAEAEQRHTDHTANADRAARTKDKLAALLA